MKRWLLKTSLIFPVFFSCIFNTDISLENDIPQCISHRVISKNLFFPENNICTLTVEDLNDSRLQLLVCPGNDYAVDNKLTDTVPWYGNCTLLQETYDKKELWLTLDSNFLGLYTGTLIIKDAHNSCFSLPFTINKIFCDSFDSPILSRHWSKYSENDTESIGFDYTDHKLQFKFSQLHKLMTTGVRSTFKIGGDFRISVDIKLRDEMLDGFETGFLVSNRPDTSRWGASTGGIFLYGKDNQLSIECRSNNLQSYIMDESRSCGTFEITRQGSKLIFYFSDGNNKFHPQSITTHSYDQNSEVYIHLRMKVLDNYRNRHCLWNNLTVHHGYIIQ